MARRRQVTISAPPLPATVEELDAHRVMRRQRDFNDIIEELNRVMYSNPKYRALLEAVVPEKTVEGSIGADTIVAAQMIRAKANEGVGHSVVKNAKLADIAKTLGTVLRRYKLSRKQRRAAGSAEMQAAE